MIALLFFMLKASVVIIALVLFCIGVILSCMSHSDIKAIIGMAVTVLLSSSAAYGGFQLLNHIAASH